MNVTKVITEVWTFEADFEVNGEQLTLKHGKQLPPLLIEKIRENKPSIIEAMLQDRQARESGFLPHISFEVYEKQITPNAHVFIIKNAEGKWDAWRETFGHPRSVIDTDDKVNKMVRKSKYVKVIALESATLDFAILKVKEYMKKIKEVTYE